MVSFLMYRKLKNLERNISISVLFLCSASSNNEQGAGSNKEDENELPAEYLNSSLAKESQVNIESITYF